MEENKQVDYRRVWNEIKKKKRSFFITLPLVFILSCAWILPQPRLYNCEVMLAPEDSETPEGGLTSLASSFGISLGGASNDAIYPMLYPDLFGSPEFIVDLFHIKVSFVDSEQNPQTTDLYTYLKKHQKKNPYAVPFNKMKKWISGLFSSENKQEKVAESADALDPFHLSKKDYQLVGNVNNYVKCTVDKKTNVITLSVFAQDAVVSATLADSIRLRLQNYITQYRTRKAREDVAYYQNLCDSAYIEYQKAMSLYASYCDQNQDVFMQAYVTKRDALENEMGVQYQAYTTIKAQLVAAQAKVQERTPVFTTLKSASVPDRPIKPKRMIFVFSMVVLAFFVTMIYHLRSLIADVI